MKNFQKIAFLLFVVFASILGCDKDSDEPDTNTANIDEYFNVTGASLVNESFPSSTGSTLVISSIYGNGSVLPGGSSVISLVSTSSFTHILIGVEGINQYYRLSATNTGSSTYNAVLMMPQDLSKENFTIVVAITDGTNVSEHKTIAVHKVEAGTGDLQVSLSWDQPNDLDLYLIEPDQEQIFYGNSSSSNGGELDVDSNAGCYIDNINNENITYSDDDTIELGTYSVMVDLYSNCDVPTNTNFVVTTYYKGSLISPSSGSNPYQGTFNANSTTPVTAMTFNIGASRMNQNTDKIQIIKFDFPKENYNSKPKNLSPQK